METFIYLLITIPIGLGFSILGIYAWKRKKPMWFWSGTEVKAGEISEDQQKDEEDKIQKTTDKFTAEIDKMIEVKTKELMTV